MLLYAELSLSILYRHRHTKALSPLPLKWEGSSERPSWPISVAWPRGWGALGRGSLPEEQKGVLQPSLALPQTCFI